MPNFHRSGVLGVAFGVLALLTVTVGPVSAQTWDITTDWSDAANPNGAWTYREGNNALPHVASWQSTLGGFTAAQPGWARSENGTDRLPFWFKALGAEDFTHDWLPGDVVVHTTDSANGVGSGLANVTWTSPITGTINVTGAVWMGRDIGRSNDWSLLFDGAPLTGGSIASGDAFSRANPFLFSAGSGGTGVLSNIPVTAGDVLTLQLAKTSDFGDFVGVQFTIQGTPIGAAAPEPGTFALLVVAAASGGAGALLRRRRK